jgi:hypothetical protein
MMTHGNEVMARTTRTAPLVDFDAVARRIDDVRDAAKAAGRDADAIELAVAGVWPMLDVRRGWDVDRCLADVASLESLGVGWIVSTCCGDDPAASHDTVRHFGAAVVDGTKRT